MEEPGKVAGLAGAVRDIVASLVAMLSTRVELAAVEMREATQHGVRIAVLAAAGAVFALLALAFAGAFVVLLFWDTHRVAVMAGVLAFYAAIAAFALTRAMALARAMPRAFDETRRTLAADRELLKTPG
jgi:uncharacterized membrane protein YqjE